MQNGGGGLMGSAVVRRFAVGIVAACIAITAEKASALDPSLEVSQYQHTVWTGGEGLSVGVIGSIAQTSDGYLWFGSSSGLLRFDGVRSVAWRPPAGTALPDERVRALLATRDGSLWIGTFRGLAIWKDGKLTLHERLKGATVNALEEDSDGTVWVGGAGKDVA